MRLLTFLPRHAHVAEGDQDYPCCRDLGKTAHILTRGVRTECREKEMPQPLSGPGQEKTRADMPSEKGTRVLEILLLTGHIMPLLIRNAAGFVKADTPFFLR